MANIGKDKAYIRHKSRIKAKLTRLGLKAAPV